MEREREERGAQRGAAGAGGWLQALRGHAGIYSQINNSTLNKPPWTGETDPPRHMWARIYKCLHPLRKRGEAVDPARYLQWAPEVNKMWTGFLWPASFPHHSPSTPFFSYLKDPGRKLFCLAHEPILKCTYSIHSGLSQALKHTDNEVVVIFMDWLTDWKREISCRFGPMEISTYNHSFQNVIFTAVIVSITIIIRHNIRCVYTIKQ